MRRPHNNIFLIIGTFKRVPLILGNPKLSHGYLQALLEHLGSCWENALLADVRTNCRERVALWECSNEELYMKSRGARELHAAFEACTSSLHGSSPPAVASEDMLTLCAPAEKAGLEALLLLATTVAE